MFHFIQLVMSNVSDRVTQLMEMKASSQEYLTLRKASTEDARVLLKKLLRKISDTAYKLKRSANTTDGDQQEKTKADKSKAEHIESNVSDNDLDLCKNV